MHGEVDGLGCLLASLPHPVIIFSYPGPHTGLVILSFFPPSPNTFSSLDFDEELPPLDALAMVDRIRSLSQQVDATLQTARHGQLLRSGLQVGI